MKKILIIALIAVIVVGAGSFYVGMKYAQGKSGRGFANLSDGQRQEFMANAGKGLNSQGGGMRQGNNFVSGEIISKDDKSITVKLLNGGSKIVFYSDSTKISEFVDGKLSDLVIGETISVDGSSNEDGSLTAQSIQIRPIITNLPSPSPVK